MGRKKLYRCGKHSRYELQQYGRLSIKTLLLDQLEVQGKVTQTFKKCTAKCRSEKNIRAPGITKQLETELADEQAALRFLRGRWRAVPASYRVWF